jgi:uncharacterized membrane protein YraQ (UPF0718 family)
MYTTVEWSIRNSQASLGVLMGRQTLLGKNDPVCSCNAAPSTFKIRYRKCRIRVAFASVRWHSRICIVLANRHTMAARA